MSRLHSGADAMAALLGGPAVAGEEAERRRAQNAAMDDFLRGHGADPAATMRIDPATAGRSLDAIMASSAPKGDAPASAPAAKGPATPAQIGPAPQVGSGAGSLPVNFTPSDAMIGAGINVRDNEQTQVAKMGLKRQHEAAALEAMTAAQRNQVAGRQVDAALFDTKSRGWSEFEKMMAGERKEAADADQFGRKLGQDRALAEMIQKGEMDKERFAVGPEMGAAAEKAAILQAIAQNPAQAREILAAVMGLKNGTLAAPPPAPTATAPPASSGFADYIERTLRPIPAEPPGDPTAGQAKPWWQRPGGVPDFLTDSMPWQTDRSSLGTVFGKR